MVFIKKVVNADAGTADIVGGDDWDKLDDYFDNVATGLTAEINSTTSYRDGMFKLRNPANTFDTTVKSGAIGANRNLTLPVLTADDIAVTQASAQTLTNKTVDVESNVIKQRLHSYVIFKDGSTYYSQKYDGTINSNADFSTVLQAIIDSIATRDDTVRTTIKIAPGDYDVNTTISIFDKYNLSIEGSGMGITRIRAGATLGSNRLINMHGAVSGTQKNLTVNTVTRAKTVTMLSGDAATFAVDDWVLVRSTLNFGSGGAADGAQGEIKQIASVSGTTVAFREALFDTYATVNTANIIKLLPMRNISFSNFTLDRHASYTPGGSVKWWYMMFVDRLEINKCEVVDFPGQFRGAMAIHSCTSVKVSDCHFQQNIAYNFQYGVSFHGACQNCVVTNSTAHGDWRHPFEVGAGEIGTNEEGVCRNIRIVNCTATGGSQNCFDSHPEGEGIYFINCGALGTNDGGGIKLRSKRSAAIGCYVQNCNQTVSGQHAIMISDDASDCIISNCHVINCDSNGIFIKDGLDGNVIEGCYIENCSGDGIKVDTGGANRTMIRNNVVIANTGDGLDLADVDNAIITGNRISTNTGWGINFTAGDCQNNVITSNSLSGNTAGSKNNGGQTGCIEASNFGY